MKHMNRREALKLDVEFVCIPRPIARAAGEEGGPVLYRVTHHVPLWSPGDVPRVERRDLEGTPPTLA